MDATCNMCQENLSFKSRSTNVWHHHMETQKQLIHLSENDGLTSPSLPLIEIMWRSPTGRVFWKERLLKILLPLKSCESQLERLFPVLKQTEDEENPADQLTSKPVYCTHNKIKIRKLQQTTSLSSRPRQAFCSRLTLWAALSPAGLGVFNTSQIPHLFEALSGLTALSLIVGNGRVHDNSKQPTRHLWTSAAARWSSEIHILPG